MPSAKDRAGEDFLGYVGDMPCYRCRLRGNGLTDTNSNWRLWNADMKVFRDTDPAFTTDDSFSSKEDETLAKMERFRKAKIWFSVSEALREKYLTDMGGRDKTSEDVMYRLWQNVAPPGTPYEPLEKLEVTEEMRANIKAGREWKPAGPGQGNDER